MKETEKSEMPPRNLAWKTKLAKWRHWEFWPLWLANVPIAIFYTWFALRARNLLFFSNVNPAIPLSGFCGESKMDILNLLPPEILPKTLLIKAGQPFSETLSELEKTGIGFPLVAKPDIGERGFIIKKCDSPEDLKSHLEKLPADFILQEFLRHPMEMTVLFHKFPGSEKFGVTSVCVKGFLKVVGNGRSTVGELMQKDDRAILQVRRFQDEFPEIIKAVPLPGEEILLEPIGNHSRGTAFLFGNQHIDNQLIATFKNICKKIEGVHYGRFDLKCDSPEKLKNGDFKVMELNGVLGEPAHVFDPDYPVWKAYRDYYRHWKIIYRLHLAQRKMGVPTAPFSVARKIVGEYFDYKKRLGN